MQEKVLLLLQRPKIFYPFNVAMKIEDESIFRYAVLQGMTKKPIKLLIL